MGVCVSLYERSWTRAYGRLNERMRDRNVIFLFASSFSLSFFFIFITNHKLNLLACSYLCIGHNLLTWTQMPSADKRTRNLSNKMIKMARGETCILKTKSYCIESDSRSTSIESKYMKSRGVCPQTHTEYTVNAKHVGSVIQWNIYVEKKTFPTKKKKRIKSDRKVMCTQQNSLLNAISDIKLRII